MFKSKYGLIGVVLVLVFSAVSVLWVRSSVSSKVGSAASEKLNQGDFLMRQIEATNKGITLELAHKAAMQVSEDYLKYTVTQNELGAIMKGTLQQLADAGEVPRFVAVLSNPSGTKQHMTIHWMAVNGTEVNGTVKDQWISTELLNGLVKTPATKYAAKTPDDPKGATDPKPVEIPLQPGETKGKYNVKPAIYKQIGMEGVKYVMGVKLVKNYKEVKKDTFAPVYEGVLLMGFVSTPLEKAVELTLLAGRNKKLEAVASRLTGLRKKLFAAATGFYNSPHFGIEGMKPHIAMITNAQGVVISRDRDDSKLRGYSYLSNSIGKLRIIAEATKRGNAVYDVVSYEVINRFRKKDKPSSIFQAAAIPLRGADGRIVGVFSMAWPFDVRLSQVKKISDLSFAYFYGSHTFYSSLLGTSEKKALADTFNGRYGSVKTSPYVLNRNKKGRLISGEKFKIAGTNYLGSYFRHKTATLSGEKYGYITLVSTDKIASPFKGIIPLIIGFGIFVIILMIILENLVFFYFYNAIDSIDEGVQEVAAGDMEFVFGRVSKETEGLSNSLNEMLNVFFGREPLDEESGEAPVKSGIQLLSMGDIPEMAYLGDDERVASFAEMSDDAFAAHLYEQFKAAWAEFGEEAPVPSQDLFSQRVKLYERMVLRQMECSRVFFSVSATEEAIEITPLPVS